MEGVVEWSDACCSGGHTRIGVPDGDGVAAGRSGDGDARLRIHRAKELGADGGHKDHNEEESCLEAHHNPFCLLLRRLRSPCWPLWVTENGAAHFSNRTAFV